MSNSRMKPRNQPKRSAADPPERNAPVWIKAFVIFHILAITVWALPNPPEGIRQGKIQPAGTTWLLVWDKNYVLPAPPIQQYLMVTGFWQYWDMFAPDPVQTDVWCDADVVYKNGRIRNFAYPRIASLPIVLKYPKERYRKFYERAGSPDSAYLWAQFGQRIALLCDDEPQNPPVEVRMRKHVLPIAPPGKPQQKDYIVETYWTYVVDQKRLAQDKARGR